MKRLLALTLVCVTLAIAGGISGRITDAATGAPIANALVTAKSRAGEAGRAQTNDRGAYEIENLAAGDYRVAAAARGYVSAPFPRPVAVEERGVTPGIDIALRLAAPELGSIAGKVIDRRTGEPVAGAVVAARNFGFHARARSDERGNYVIRGLKPGRYEVVAGARGYRKELFPRPVPVEPGQSTDNIDFALQPKPRKGVMSGTVLDERTGRPVPGAVIIARGEHGTFRAVTNRNGDYVMKANPGNYQVICRAHGYRPETCPRLVPVAPRGVTKDIDFALRRLHLDAD